MTRVPTPNRLISTLAVLLISALAAAGGSVAHAGDTDPRKAPARQASNASEPEWLTWIAKSNSTKSSSWWPSWGTSTPKRVPSYSRNNKSTWQKMSQTSKRWWEKTKDALDPYPPPKPVSQSKSSKGSSWFGSWFESKPEKKIESVPDFLRQASPK